MTGVVAVVCAGIPFAALLMCYRFAPPLGYMLESFLCYQPLAAKSLKTESMKVCRSLPDGDTEAVCAGALGIRLAGPAVYFGKVHDKPYIGDDTRPVQPEDIAGANKLMLGACFLTLLLAILFRLGVIVLASI